jgi:predicted DNA-binding protein
MNKNDIGEIKVYLPKELKDKFAAKAKKESKSQTEIIKSLIHKYLDK